MNCSLEEAIRLRCEADGPIRVAVVGAGASGAMIIRHLLRSVPWIRLVAIANRTSGRASDLLVREGGRKQVEVRTEAELTSAIELGEPVVVSDVELLCRSPHVELLVEATGTVDFGASVVLSAVRNHKHVVLVNAELDSTLGPILRANAKANGVVLSHTDGEEPGVAMTLLRYVKSVGLRPVGAGNLKGMIDRYRTPETQRAFAARHHMDPAKVSSFADGTKLSMEACILANATGFQVGRRGMHGPKCSHVREIASLLPSEALLDKGLVDYALGAEPHTGAFVIAFEEDSERRRDLAYFKMGDGPFYVYYTPYHLPHIQIASTIARAILFSDATVAPIDGPVCEVATVAKRDLKAGELLDGVGGYMSYGLIENVGTFSAENLLPIGVAGGCRLIRDITRDSAVTYADVELPDSRLCDRLRDEQAEHFERDRPKPSRVADFPIRTLTNNCR